MSVSLSLQRTPGKRSTPQTGDGGSHYRSVSCQPKEPPGHHRHDLHAQQWCGLMELIQGPGLAS